MGLRDDLAAARANAAANLPHYVELDEVERELLAGVILEAIQPRRGRLSRPTGEIRILNELRERIRPRFRPEDMDTNDGIGA